MGVGAKCMYRCVCIGVCACIGLGVHACIGVDICV